LTRVISFKGRVLLDGTAKGEALVSRRAFTFAHGVEPSTGVVTDVRSDLRGENVREKILFFPFGKGSTTGAAWFLETVRLGNGPAAVLTQTAEPMIVTGAILGEILYGRRIPVMADFPPSMADVVRTGDLVSVETKNNEVTVSRGAS
jgi:uncharacterized protein